MVKKLDGRIRNLDVGVQNEKPQIVLKNAQMVTEHPPLTTRFASAYTGPGVFRFSPSRTEPQKAILSWLTRTPLLFNPSINFRPKGSAPHRGDG